MSRIGKKPVALNNVTVDVTADNLVTVKGAKGTLTYQVPSVITVKVENNEVIVTRNNEEKHTRQLHGTVRANIQNMVTGVSEGFKKNLVMVGTGYKAEVSGKQIVLNVGYSHPIKLDIPQGVTVTVGGNNNTAISVEGIDKQVVGQLAALIRGTRAPEPYLGKGVAYVGEHIRRKEGKKAAKK